MKKILLTIFILSLIINKITPAETVDFIIAKVGRDIILFSDLARQMNQMRNAQMLDSRMTESDILESMVENKLIVQKARELGIRIDERRIANMLDSQMAQIRSAFDSDEQFHRELRNAGLTQSELRQYYHDLLVEQFLRERLIQSEIRSKIRITDAELHQFFIEESENFPVRDTAYEFAMILRMPGASDETINNSLLRIQEIEQLLDEGGDFAELARQYSECPSASSGGDLGYFSRGMMVESFENAAFNLEIDEISEIVRTDFGFHIIKLTGKRGNDISASHILILVEETEQDVLLEREILVDLKTRIENGEDFIQLALEYSEDENSKQNNGILGSLTKEEFPPWFSNELSDLEINQVTEILEYQNILYLFKLMDIIEPRPFEFEEISEQLRELMLSRRQLELYDQWIEALRHEIFVELYEDRLNEFLRN